MSDYLPRESVGFPIDAAQADGAEAPAILAVLAAAGARAGQSRNEGLSAFVLVAERGWRLAPGQLCVLAPDHKLAASAPELSPGTCVSDETDFSELGVRHEGTQGRGSLPGFSVRSLLRARAQRASGMIFQLFL